MKQPVQTSSIAADAGLGAKQGLLRAAEAGCDATTVWSHWLPTIEVNMVEARASRRTLAELRQSLTPASVCYNLSESLSPQRRRLADSNIQQVN